MSDNDGKPGDQGGTASGSGGDGSATTVSFTQSELDAKFADRARRAEEAALAKVRETYGDLDELVKKAKRFEELDSANQSEIDRARKEAEDARKEAEKAQAELAETKRRSLIVAKLSEAGLPASKLVDRVLGTTEDEIDADVKELVELIGKAKAPDLGAGARKPGESGGITQEEAESMSVEEYRKAVAEGRVT